LLLQIYFKKKHDKSVFKFKKTFFSRAYTYAILEDPGVDGRTGVDGRIIFRWIFRNWDVREWTGSM
jgi:hypothetical protein